ncbi:MAG: alanyl-tRNA editing protein, partial [Burkholderiales bacterium]
MPTALLFRDDAYLRSCSATVTATGERGFEVDRTVFYPAGGGQPGDAGTLRRADGSSLRIVDTRKGEAPDSVVHVVEDGAAPPAPGERVDLELDWERRYAHMRIHTCLHVLSCVVVAPVTGGNIATDRGRLDFDIDMSLLDAERIEREV